MASRARTKRQRSIRQAERATRADDDGRYIDLAIELRVVAQDLDEGCAYVPGLPGLRPLAVHRIGGRLDRVTRSIVGPPERYLVWYVGKKQADIIVERDLPQSRTLLYSAEGGGKTVLGVQWLLWGMVLDVCAGTPGPRGKVVNNLATAPVREKVLNLVEKIGERVPIDSVREMRPGAWGTFYADRREIRFPALGHTIKLIATKRQSAATGSPVQSISVKRSLDDELQDTAENGADPDIEARLRGWERTERLGTASAKDSSTWRRFRDAKLASPDWRIERIRFDENPFEWPSRWEVMRRNMSAREWQRRGLAMDVGPERMLYTAWDPERSLRPVPRIGAKDITAQVLGGFHALVGHDPGTLHDVSIVLKCYEVERRRCWWVIDEVTTDGTTTEQHIAELGRRLRDTWQLQYPQADEPKAIVRCDPYGDSDNKTDRSVYTSFKLAGFRCLSAAYSKNGLGTGRIDREARIEMVQRLLCNAADERRLFVACDEKRVPAAPKLVDALEMSEREEGTGKAERGKKGKKDLTHWPAALGYALWPYERVRDIVGPAREALV